MRPNKRVDEPIQNEQPVVISEETRISLKTFYIMGGLTLTIVVAGFTYMQRIDNRLAYIDSRLTDITDHMVTQAQIQEFRDDFQDANPGLKVPRIPKPDKPEHQPVPEYPGMSSAVIPTRSPTVKVEDL